MTPMHNPRHPKNTWNKFRSFFNDKLRATKGLVFVNPLELTDKF